MLCLSRRKNERVIFIGPNGERCSVLITRINGNHVGLGLDFPKAWRIVREELDGEPEQKEAAA